MKIVQATIFGGAVMIAAVVGAVALATGAVGFIIWAVVLAEHVVNDSNEAAPLLFLPASLALIFAGGAIVGVLTYLYVDQKAS